MWLVIVDAFTKWIEIIPTSATTSESTIRVLRQIFARFGCPRSVVSDNGSQFTSEEFASFMKSNNITHMKSSPYHSRTNGLAERAVRTFKDRIKAAGELCDTEIELQRFLFSYRNTPTKATGRSPAEAMFGRHLRTPVDLLKPDVRAHLSNAAAKEKLSHDAHTKERHFSVGELVWCWDERKNTHVPGLIKKRTGIWSYIVTIDGKKHRRHADRLRKRYLTERPKNEEPSEDDNDHEEQTVVNRQEPVLIDTTNLKHAPPRGVATPVIETASQTLVSSATARNDIMTKTSSQQPVVTVKDVAAGKIMVPPPPERRSERGHIPRKPLPYDKFLDIEAN